MPQIYVKTIYFVIIFYYNVIMYHSFQWAHMLYSSKLYLQHKLEKIEHGRVSSDFTNKGLYNVLKYTQAIKGVHSGIP